MNKEDKRGIFFGVVGVLTLIVAIIGASLAYFSINARSDDDAITVQAATVQIVYESGTKLNVADIIPASQAVATETFERYLNKETYTDKTSQEQVTYNKCVDDNGYNVCGAYNFTLTNNGPTATTITMTVEPTELEEATKKFKNLSYILYDITGVTEDEDLQDYAGLGTLVKQGVFSVTTDSEGNVTGYNDTIVVDYDEENTENNLSIGSGSTNKYRLFVWLNEVNGTQDYEQGAMFQGAISIEVAGAENSTITGNADSTIGA